MLAGDHDTARRLQLITLALRTEAELLDDETVRGVPVPRTAPIEPGGARHTIGHLVRYDPAARALRRLRGLPVPELAEAVRDAV
jgi:hypothetical protein